MKSLNEIEQMDVELLEKISEDGSIKVPAGLENKMTDTVLAASFKDSTLKRKAFWPTFSLGMAICAACMGLILAIPSQPKDTFSDPELAYAEIEKTFLYISSKMDRGLEIASEAEPVLETANNAINR